VLYVACSQSGLAAEPSDFLLAIDLRDGVEHRALGELRLGGAAEEIRIAEWASADRSRLAVLGADSSQLFLVDVATDPSRPRLEAVVGTAELEQATGYRHPAAVAPFPGGDLLLALRSGGRSGYGGLALLSGGELTPLGGPADGPIVALAACPRGDRVALAYGGTSPALAVRRLDGGDRDDVRALPATPCAVTASAASSTVPGSPSVVVEPRVLRPVT
jgi:hypothetical protein